MTKFSWMDVGYSRDEHWREKIVDLEFHTSTMNLISRFLRNRECDFRKIFIDLIQSRDQSVKIGAGMAIIESLFDFKAYSAAPAQERLDIFAIWILETLLLFTPQILIESEVGVIRNYLLDRKYVYTTQKKVPIIGSSVNERCNVVFLHSPFDVLARVICKGVKEDLILPGGIFIRHHFDYLGRLNSCSIDSGRVVVDVAGKKYS